MTEKEKERLTTINEMLELFYPYQPLQKVVDFINGEKINVKSGGMLSYFFSKIWLEDIKLFMKVYGLDRQTIINAYLRMDSMLRCRATSGFPMDDWLVEVDPSPFNRLW